MNNQTVEKLRSMRLGAMAQLHQQYVKENRFESITCDEYLALLLDINKTPPLVLTKRLPL